MINVVFCFIDQKINVILYDWNLEVGTNYFLQYRSKSMSEFVGRKAKIFIIDISQQKKKKKIINDIYCNLL